MTLLSRYVLKQFLSPLALSLSAFTLVFLVIDLVDRLSSFIDQGTAVGAILMFYVFYIPYIVVLVLPMSVLLAGLFCMGTLIRNGELLAMKAIGISLYQVVIPLQFCALVVSFCAFILTDQVVPRANRKRAAMTHPRQSELGPRYVRSQVVLRDVNGQMISLGEYDPSAMRARRVIIDRFHEGLKERIRAEEMVWQEDHWVGYRVDFRNLSEGRETFSTRDVYPIDGITLTPADFAREARPEEEMTLMELRVFIERKERNGSQALREQVAAHMRLAFPMANFVIGLFGLPLASRMRRTGRPLQVGVCLLTCFAFYGCIQMGRAMGWNDVIPPVWGAWGANGLFAAIGIVLLVKTRK